MAEALPFQAGFGRALSGAIERRPTRPVIYDLSHLILRLRAHTGTGIDRVDLAFASHFFASSTEGEAARFASGQLRLMPARRAMEFTRAAQNVWTEDGARRSEALRSWLAGPPGLHFRRPTPRSRLSADAWSRRLLAWSAAIAGGGRSLPSQAIYLNIGYHLLEESRCFEWLRARADVDGVFMIHDLLPLDYPEYFAAGDGAIFRARMKTALRLGSAFLVSTDAVRTRLQREIRARGLADRPIWTRPFPSPLSAFSNGARSSVATSPYFVVVGTIEPRKNHLLLLNIWREFARSWPDAPRLVIVGVRGWENEQIVDMLDRCETLRPLVAETSDLPSRDLAELIAGARALLAPSFEEGYGLPIVEALALGTPVVAAQSEASREVSQGRSTLLSPLDGEGWRREIRRLAEDATYFAAQKARAEGFRAPDWDGYFASLDQFFAELTSAKRGMKFSADRAASRVEAAHAGG